MVMTLSKRQAGTGDDTEKTEKGRGDLQSSLSLSMGCADPP